MHLYLLVYGYRKQKEKKNICVPAEILCFIVSLIAMLPLLDVSCDWMRRMQTLFMSGPNIKQEQVQGICRSPAGYTD